MKFSVTKNKIRGLIAAALTAMQLLSVPFSLAASASCSLNDNPENAQYYQKYATLDEAVAAGNEINERIAEEAIALFKNENMSDGTAALPLAKGSKISIFGSCSTNLRLSGGGSGAGSLHEGEAVSTEKTFVDAGFNINRTLYSMYESKNSRGEISISNYTSDIIKSYADYSDAAIIFISRAAGGENYDASLGNGTSKHSYEMDDNEIALFEHVKAQKDSSGNPLFKKIIVVINTSNPFEVGRFQDDDRVQGVIWMGLLGATGHKAVPKVLNGEINPSAHTVDIWPANLRQDPAWFNFASNSHVGGSINITGTDPAGNKLENAIAQDGQVANPIFKALTYKEGIYMGYRWYETAATVDGYFNNNVNGTDFTDPLHYDDAYYNRYNGVLYPFGYGLSYTSFEWTIGTPSFSSDKITSDDAGTEVTVPVTVKNTGDVAGKDVVQLYVRAPYDPVHAPIEKSEITFVNSAKTQLLQPGEEQIVYVTFNIRDLASFDWNDANDNGFQGYEIEAGTYDLLFRTDSHTDKDADTQFSYVVNKTIKYNSDDINSPLNYNQGFGENAKALFSQADEYNCSGVGAINAKGDHTTVEDADYVSRSDWKLPTPSSADQLAWTSEALYILFNQTYTSAAGTNGDKPSDPWYKTANDIPGYGKSPDELTDTDWKQASDADVAARVEGKTKIQLKDMIGVPLSDPKWITFMNQLTFDEMVSLTQNGWYESAGLNSIGKPKTVSTDGPGQFNHKGTFWTCETSISATYNTELAYEMGAHVAQEAMILNIEGWYAPGLNTHRISFNGRNFEYYSSDGRQGGWIAAAVIMGAVDNGLHVFAKHYVCNDMETCRNYGGGMAILLTEQSLREIYLKPFEIAAKYGKMNGIMTCHGKVGMLRVESNYHLSNTFLYGECGFTGSNVTDANTGSGYTTTVGGSAQQVTGDRLERCFIVPLSWNTTAASNDAALNGRKVEGRYDAENNKLMVPEIYVSQEDWHFTGNHNGYEESTGYQTTVTNSGVWDQESPTQWWHVRMNALYLLYNFANGMGMSDEYGNQVGVVVSVYNTDGEVAEEINCNRGQIVNQPETPVYNPAFERFMGWYYDEACTSSVSFPIAANTPIKLYPLIVSQSSCIQTYDLNYAGAPDNITEFYEVDSLVRLPAFAPTREGYIFDGWYKEASCINKVDANNSQSLIISNDRTFYAKWIPIKQLTVSFSYNYEGAPDAQMLVVNAGDKVMPPAVAPVRDGYVFDGWYIDESCEYEVDFSEPIDYDTTYYACWKSVDNSAGNTSGGIGGFFAAIIAWFVSIFKKIFG